MSVREQRWYPYASAAVWGLVVLVLVLVNSGNVLLALLLGALVALISWRIDGRARGQSGGSASS